MPGPIGEAPQDEEDGMRKGRGKRPSVRREEAEERQARRDKRSPAQQIEELDRRDQPAKRERVRLTYGY